MNQQSRKAMLASKWIAQAPEMLEDVELRDGRKLPRAVEVWVPKKKVHAPSIRCGPCPPPPGTPSNALMHCKTSAGQQALDIDALLWA